MQGWDRLLSTLPGQQPGAMQAQARGTCTPVATCLCENLCMAFMHVHVFDAGVITYPQIHVHVYITGDHSLAIPGHQGSSLSLKHGLCVSASFNSLHTAPLKTG